MNNLVQDIHIETEKTEGCFSSQFSWPNIRPKIMEFVRKCRDCAIRKPISENTTASLQTITTTKPLEILAIDFVGPFVKTHDNKRYFLTCINHFTKHTQAYATEKCDSQTVIKCIEQYCCTFWYT
jgi:hypothetical protein